MYYKQVENNIILSIGILEVANDSLTEITETEYNNLLAIDDVPETYKEEVKAKLPNNDYGIDDTTYNNVIDDYTMELVEKGVL